MFDHETLTKIFSHWTHHPNALADEVLKTCVHLGKEMYVVAKYLPSSPYQVVKVTVTKMRYDPRKDKKYFSVEGKWSNGCYYNGTFNKGSIEKTIFSRELDANDQAEKKNARREKNGN